MARNTSPGLGQWMTVAIMVSAAIFLLYKLYLYAGSRSFYPTGLTIGGVPVEGMTREQASEALNNVYLSAPVVIYHGEQSFEINPTDAEFTLNLEAMLSDADFQRVQQDFWAGFWGYLWARSIEVQPVPLQATHNREALRQVLEEIAVLMDRPSQPAQPVPTTLSFQYGETGTTTNIESSFDDVEAALYRPSGREAHLVIEPQNPTRPEINLLARLLVNHLQDFEQQTGGVSAVFIIDLQNGEEVAISADIPMSSMDLMRIPIALETFRVLDNPPTLSQQQLLSDTLIVQPDFAAANNLLRVIAGSDDAYAGADQVTATMQRLGLVNTFMVAPFGADARPGRTTLGTPANSVEVLRTAPDPYMQTTAEDMGQLFSMIYFCAKGMGGALTAVFPEQVTQAECQSLLNYMQHNQIDSLLEEGMPEETVVAHRHGWVSDTHGDAGIVFSPGGDYVIVEILYKPDWLEWDISSPLLAEISRAAYNFFNFDNPYLANSSTN